MTMSDKTATSDPLEGLYSVSRKVVSSSIEKLSFIEKMQFEEFENKSVPAMAVTFKGNSLYIDVGVSREAFEKLLNAESVGTLFHSDYRDVYPAYQYVSETDSWRKVEPKKRS